MKAKPREAPVILNGNWAYISPSFYRSRYAGQSVGQSVGAFRTPEDRGEQIASCTLHSAQTAHGLEAKTLNGVFLLVHNEIDVFDIAESTEYVVKCIRFGAVGEVEDADAGGLFGILPVPWERRNGRENVSWLALPCLIADTFILSAPTARQLTND